MTTTTTQPGVNLDWDTLTLARGSHELGDTDDCGNQALCFMEAFNVSRRLGVTDRCPTDVSETLHGFIVGLNDSLGTVQRQRLKLYRDRIVGTSGQPDADRRAAYMSVDWLIRTYTVAFLRLAGLTAHADALAGAGEVVDLVTLGQVTNHISVADSVAYSVAGSAAGSVARSAARSAAGAAARSAARSVADSAARSAADSVAYSVAYSAARSVSRSAAYSVAYSVADSVSRSAAYSAADQMLAPTVTAMQASAFDLLDRMLAAYTVVTA